MAIRIQTLGATELRPASNIIKRAFPTAITIGGASGQVVGDSLWAMVKLPATFIGNQLFNILGADTDSDGLVNETGQTGLQIGGPSSGTSTRRMRWRIETTSVNDDTMTQFADGTGYLIGTGTTNTGTNATPVWRNWIAFAPIGGTPESVSFAHLSPYTSSSTVARLANIFAAAATGSARTPINFEIEHVAYIDGDFPWDTANNRPHLDAIAALAGSGGNPFLTYETLIAAQNAGTLPYSNIRTEGGAQGRSALTYYWRLANLSALTNAGTGPANALSEVNFNSLSNGLVASSTFAPAHWSAVTAPTINTPLVLFHGGRGLRALARSGTYGGSTTSVQRRWLYGNGAVNGTAGTVVPGFDWSSAGISLAGGNWSFSETLPYGGPYTLEIRDTNDTANIAAPLSGNIVGTIITLWGQSGAALALLTGFSNPPLGPNLLSVPVANGALGWAMRLDNIDAGGSGTYARPIPITATMLQGTTPNVGHGLVRAINEWNAHDPGMPLGIVIPAVNGIAMTEWNANGFVLGSTSWRFMGTKTAPGATAGETLASGSGVAGYTALLLDSYVDLHAMMWTGIGDLQSDRTTWTGLIDALFTNSPTAPYRLMPPWRGRRDPGDSAANITTRNNAIAFVAELGARGSLGGYWPDIVSDATGTGANGSLHPAFCSAPGVPSSLNPVSDARDVGQGKIGRRFGRDMAEFFNSRIKAGTYQIVGAWWVDPLVRTSIIVQLPCRMRTLNGATMANRFSFSLNNGVTWGTWGQAGNGDTTAVTATLSADGLFVTLTRVSGAWPASGVRVDYCRDWPFGPSDTASSPNADLDEADAEVALHALLYDNQTYAGNTNLAQPAGNPLASANKVGAGVAGVGVAAKAAATLKANKKIVGSRVPTIRMTVVSTGQVVEKTPTITAS